MVTVLRDRVVHVYRSRLLLGVGNDSLGYDFKVPYRSQQLYLEVKSHMGDPLEFELGETEVRFAAECARSRGRQYRIIYVSNVQDTDAMRLEMLPNPLSNEGRPHFRIGGQRFRYRFERGH